MDVLVGEAKVGGSDCFFCVGRSMLVVRPRPNLAALLSRVLLVGEPTLGLGLDLERVGLSSMSSGNWLVVNTVRLGKPGGTLGRVIGE